MNVVISVEHRFDRTPDGLIWTEVAFSYRFWKRYLAVFDHVHVVARVRDVPSVLSGSIRADGEGVSFKVVPHYLGPWEYLKRIQAVQLSVESALHPGNAYILRVPSQIAAICVPWLDRRNYPYGLEVVGDPAEVFASGAVRHPLRPFFRRMFTRRLRAQCAKARAVAYVTKDALQQRYPAQGDAFTTHFSSVELPEEAILSTHRSYAGKDNFTLITVGSLEQLYKAPDVLIDALAICLNMGLDIKLAIVGDGKYRPYLEERVRNLGVERYISFLGQLPAGPKVRHYLDQADIFVLPSRTEGLPRAMIEAMARGLPCIGSTVGGIPELLSAEDMVSPGDAGALAAKIREVVTSPERLSRMSQRNLEKAREYSEDILSKRRTAFYKYIREQTELWVRTR